MDVMHASLQDALREEELNSFMRLSKRCTPSNQRLDAKTRLDGLDIFYHLYFRHENRNLKSSCLKLSNLKFFIIFYKNICLFHFFIFNAENVIGWVGCGYWHNKFIFLVKITFLQTITCI